MKGYDGTVADVLEEHQRCVNNKAPSGQFIVACRCTWQQAYSERGRGYRLWAEHVEQVLGGHVVNKVNLTKALRR
jgi:hypothetical protein